MRLFLLLLFISFSALSQIDTGNGSDGPCDGTTPSFAAGGTFNCASLNLNGLPITTFNLGANPLIIKVQGSVSISGLVSVSGRDGILNDFFAGVNPGGQGGPGAGNGGGNNATNLLGGSDALSSSGQASLGGRPGCEDGGGGAGYKTAGTDGVHCGTGISHSGAKGVSTIEMLRGGFGGGAGGNSDNGTYGGGGGGGGFIRIIADGDIFISAGAQINAQGGAGGPGGPNGGGGGGGSGGIIWLQSNGNIQNDGNLNVQGGIGGVATALGNGGNGGNGFLRIEDLDGIPTGTGTAPGAEFRSTLNRTSGLKSDISCGAIKPNQETNSAFMQIILGFMLALTFGYITKHRSKFFS